MCSQKLILNIQSLESLELHNNYPLAPDETDIKKEIFSKY